MNTWIHDGRALSFNENTLVLRVRDEKLQEDVEVHWTSYWGDIPALVPRRNEPLELVYTGTPEKPRLLAARPKRGGS
jgi:hypothetical protein